MTVFGSSHLLETDTGLKYEIWFNTGVKIQAPVPHDFVTNRKWFEAEIIGRHFGNCRHADAPWVAYAKHAIAWHWALDQAWAFVSDVVTEGNRTRYMVQTTGRLGGCEIHDGHWFEMNANIQTHLPSLRTNIDNWLDTVYGRKAPEVTVGLPRTDEMGVRGEVYPETVAILRPLYGDTVMQHVHRAQFEKERLKREADAEAERRRVARGAMDAERIAAAIRQEEDRDRIAATRLQVDARIAAESARISADVTTAIRADIGIPTPVIPPREDEALLEARSQQINTYLNDLCDTLGITPTEGKVFFDPHPNWQDGTILVRVNTSRRNGPIFARGRLPVAAELAERADLLEPYEADSTPPESPVVDGDLRAPLGMA